MNSRRFLTLVASLFLANGLLFFGGSSSLEAGTVETKSCVCVDGSDPEGPQGPGDPACIEYLYDECTSAAECSCPLG